MIMPLMFVAVRWRDQPRSVLFGREAELTGTVEGRWRGMD